MPKFEGMPKPADDAEIKRFFEESEKQADGKKGPLYYFVGTQPDGSIISTLGQQIPISPETKSFRGYKVGDTVTVKESLQKSIDPKNAHAGVEGILAACGSLGIPLKIEGFTKSAMMVVGYRNLNTGQLFAVVVNPNDFEKFFEE